MSLGEYLLKGFFVLCPVLLSIIVLDDATKERVDSEDGVVNSTLRIQIKAGEEGKSPYKVTAKVVTTASPPNKWEMDINIKVKEI